MAVFFWTVIEESKTCKDVWKLFSSLYKLLWLLQSACQNQCSGHIWLMIIVTTPRVGLTIHTVEDISMLIVIRGGVSLTAAHRAPHSSVTQSLRGWVTQTDHWVTSTTLLSALIHSSQYDTYSSIHCVYLFHWRHSEVAGPILWSHLRWWWLSPTGRSQPG